MKAIFVNNDESRSLVWTDVEEPVLRDGEVRIRVYYAALNRADLMQREGDYPPPPDCPEWMGLEVSGEIANMSETAEKESSFRVGDKVCALLGGGGYAEYVNVPWGMVMPVPDGLDMASAAALPEAFATAYLNLFIVGGIKPDDTLLMNAGASGLASVVIPMAKAFGIRVITTIIDENKRAGVEKTGADIVVNTRTKNIAEVLKAECDAGHPVDVAVDCLGGDVMGECLEYLQRGARWIVIAALAGQYTKIDLKNIYKRNVKIIGSTLRSKTPSEKAEILASLVKNIWPKVTDGSIRPTIYKILPIQNAEEAHAILRRGENVGKVVMKVAEEE